MEYLCFLVKRICFASLSRVCILSISFQYIRNTSVLYTGAFDFDRGLPRFNYSNWSSFVLVIAERVTVYRVYISFCLFCNYVCLFVCLFVKKISVKDFSATTWVRILKFGTKLDSDELYCVTEKQPHIAYQSLYLFIFLSLQWKFLSQISQLLLEPVYSNFVYTFR